MTHASRATGAPPNFRESVVREPQGAVIRGDVAAKRMSLIFTGDQYAESTAAILDLLQQRGDKAGFFITGRFARDPALRPLVRRMVDEGHYVGPHSDAHPLYCDWDDRNKSLVTREFFRSDLAKNLSALKALGALPPGQPVLLVPPYEWYNAEQVRWAAEVGVQMINFTPGSGSNRDYAREGDARFVSSQRILQDVLAYDRREPQGLNGFLLLLHLGSGRKDPFHVRLGELCAALDQRGYELVRVDELVCRAD
ncbi:MAG: polysaccharide deacetylase family protein [Pirellulales bacterium]|nr:polysaccharide deacetylase family protein [Pirellulales bacterium]